LTDWKISEMNRSEPSSDQTLDTKTESGTQTAHLSLSSFGDRDLELTSVASELARFHSLGTHRSILERDTFAGSASRFVALP
jgi:hypothetical protein